MEGNEKERFGSEEKTGGRRTEETGREDEEGEEEEGEGDWAGNSRGVGAIHKSSTSRSDSTQEPQDHDTHPHGHLGRRGWGGKGWTDEWMDGGTG